MPSLYDSIHEPAGEKQPQQCSYKTKGGRQCPRRASEDETFCVMHGANIVRAQETVKRKLIALQEKSVAALEEILQDADDKTRLAAVTAILDRTGLGPKSTISLDAMPELSSMSTEDIAKELDTLAQKAREEMTRQRMHEALMDKVSASDGTH